MVATSAIIYNILVGYQCHYPIKNDMSLIWHDLFMMKGINMMEREKQWVCTSAEVRFRYGWEMAWLQ